MSGKRPLEDGRGSSPPPKKVQFEPVQLGPISTLEEMDVKTLKFQNHKLYQVCLIQPIVVFIYLTVNELFMLVLFFIHDYCI